MRDYLVTSTEQLPLVHGPGVATWLPDELLFSLASRHHVIAGNHLASETCMQLFGHRRRGSQHDFPSRIDEFVRRTSGVLGTPLEVINGHTILSFYLPLRSVRIADEAIASLRGDGIGSLKYRLGLLTSRFRAHHPLKACLKCMEDDRRQFHVAYWHLAHQYPGVWLCPHHDAMLMESTVKSNGVGRFLWHLPEISSLIDATAPTLDSWFEEERRDLLRRLAGASLGLARLPNGYLLDVRHMGRMYLAALQSKGMCSPKRRLRTKEVAKWFMDCNRTLSTVPEFAGLPSSLPEAEGQILRMLREPRGSTHPLRHLTFIVWLFGAWDNFWRTYQKGDQKGVADFEDSWDMTAREDSKSKDGKRLELMDLIIERGYSITRAAEVIGLDTVTAMAWAARAGFDPPRRPKLLKPDIRSRFIHDLHNGLDKKTAAARYEISIQTVTTTLRTVVGLQQAWSDARFNLACNRARALWTEVSIANQSLGIKAVRLLEPGAYAWLYRNDRLWLDSQNCLLTKNKRGNHASVDWDSRDKELAQNVRRICLEIAQETNGPKRITLQLIYQRLPQLRPKLGQLEQLPLTRFAIEEATGRRKMMEQSGRLFS